MAGHLLAQSFEPVVHEVEGFRSASLSWGDVDGDGALDLLVGGETTNGPRTRLYRSQGGLLSPDPWSARSTFTGATAWADFDGDGDLDFASGGFVSATEGSGASPDGSRIFRNDGPAGFTGLGTEINMSGLVIWSDFDGDGDPDLLMAGADRLEASSSDLNLRRIRVFVNEPGKPWRVGWEHSLPGNARPPLVDDWDRDGRPDVVYPYNRLDDTKGLVVLRNLGSWQFTATESDFSGRAWPYFLDWLDVDNDGDQDAAYSGEIGVLRVLQVVRHDPATNRVFDVAGVGGLAVAAADYDGDGRMDLATAEGEEGDFGSLLRLHRNVAAGPDPEFLPVDLPFRGAGHATLSWADVDGDGRPDLAIAGFTNQVPSFRLLRNLAPATNPAPTVPDGLGSSVGPGGSVTLGWDASTDANQPGGLTYNVRVGRSPLAGDVMPSESDAATGRLRVPRRGNAGSVRHHPLTNLVAGTYWWSVQAVDHGFAASPFAPEHKFVIAPGQPRLREVAVGEVRHRHVVLTGEVLADSQATAAWFEYGTNDVPDRATVPQAVGNGVEWRLLAETLVEVETEVEYRFQLVASNATGLVRSPLGSWRVPNTPPTLSVPVGLVTFYGRTTGEMPVTVNDLETLPGLLVLAVRPDPAPGQNTNLVAPDGIRLTRTGTDRFVQVFPRPGERGSLNLLFSLLDGHGAVVSRTVEFRVIDFQEGTPLGVDPGPSALWVDVDGDGWLDALGSFGWQRNLNGGGWSATTGATASPVEGALVPGDVDQDGRVDYAVSGARLSQRVTQVFTNRPFGSMTSHNFRPVSPVLPPAQFYGNLAWADFDGDGDEDLFGMGTTNSRAATLSTLAWRNDGALNLTPFLSTLPSEHLSLTAWADYDGDGDVDVCVLGATNRSSAGAITRLYVNDGAGNLADSRGELPRFINGWAAWGDFDGDGRPDLVLAGVRPEGNRGASNDVVLLRQNEGGGFVEWQRFPAVFDPLGVLADFDNDGRLDLLYSGRQTLLSFARRARVFFNRGDRFQEGVLADDVPDSAPSVGDFDRDRDLDVLFGRRVWRNQTLVTNAQPQSPRRLKSVVTEDQVTLSWDPGTDANQSGGHTYNVKVRPLAGGRMTMSSLTDPDGYVRRVSGPGNAWGSGRWKLRGLAPGTYRWSVQMIDHGYAASVFAPEQQFVVPEPAAVRFTGVRLGADGGLELATRVRQAGSYVLELSTDLQEWTLRATYELPAGDASLTFLETTGDARFCRLRGPMPGAP